MTVTYNGVTITCTTAIKGSDYVHLLDANGNMIASFDGVQNFGGFTLSGGSWTSPSALSECCLVALREDGTACSSGVPVGKVFNGTAAMQLTNGIHYGTTLPSTGVEGQLFIKIEA